MSEWESYWKSIEKTGNDGQVFWDVDAERASMEDLRRFKEYMDPQLPIIDLGCGNGRQSRFLAGHFRKVIGVDVSVSAIDLATRESGSKSNLEFRVFNGVDPASAAALHTEIGDANIYMRGVLHMIDWQQRRAFIRSLAILLGAKGTLYQIELTSKSILRLRSLPTEVFAQIPKVVRRVGFNMEEMHLFYPEDQWDILAQGNQVAIRSVPLEDGNEEAMPANFLILRPRRGQSAKPAA